MWRKYRESITNKKLKRIRGRKSSLLYQKQVLTVQEIFTYPSNKQIFYQFFVKGNLPHIQKNKRGSQFLAIQLSKGSSVLLLKVIREVLKREGSRRFFFIQYPIYPQFNINYLLLLIHVQDTSALSQYEDSLLGVYEKFSQAIE
ncbi:MAG: hypothetical protein EU530_01965, partial [Promethearchaeota archaeon]